MFTLVLMQNHLRRLRSSKNKQDVTQRFAVQSNVVNFAIYRNGFLRTHRHGRYLIQERAGISSLVFFDFGLICLRRSLSCAFSLRGKLFVVLLLAGNKIKSEFGNRQQWPSLKTIE